MNKYIPLIIGSLFFVNILSAQKKNKKAPLCAKIKNISASNRQNKYPFIEATSIQLVSFDEGSFIGLPIKNDTVCAGKMIEQVRLSENLINSLSNVLFNYGFKTKGSLPVSNCYHPRNAIVFLDQHGRVVDFLEICFECTVVKTGSAKFKMEDMCELKYEMLRGIFKSAGIHYGIENDK